MKRVPSALVIGGVLILISWVTAPAALTPAAPRPMSPGDRARIEQTAQAVVPLTSQLDAEADRLRARLSQPPPQPKPTRNPFDFARRDRDAVQHRDPVAENDSRPHLPALPTLPTLVAITADGTGSALILTAALAMGDELTLVRVGQSFDRFVVESITADAVRLVDTTSPTRATFTIAIR